jgi:hypothetical protein
MRKLIHPVKREWKLIVGIAIFIAVATYGYNLKSGGFQEARKMPSTLVQATVASIRIDPLPIGTMYPRAYVRIILDGQIVTMQTKAAYVSGCKPNKLIQVRVFTNSTGKTFYRLGPERCF